MLDEVMKKYVLIIISLFNKKLCYIVKCEKPFEKSEKVKYLSEKKCTRNVLIDSPNFRGSQSISWRILKMSFMNFE